MSRELDEAHDDSRNIWLSCCSTLSLYAGGILFRLSTRSEMLPMPTDLYYLVLNHLQVRIPDLQLHSNITLASSPSSKPLLSHAEFYDHVVIAGQKYSVSTRATNLSESLVVVSTSALGQTWVGELQYIFSIKQDAVGLHRFGKMKWFVPFTMDDNLIWKQ
jgi:hypothetical protein